MEDILLRFFVGCFVGAVACLFVWWDRARTSKGKEETAQPLIGAPMAPKRRMFLFVLAFGIFIVLAVAFVIFDMANR